MSTPSPERPGLENWEHIATLCNELIDHEETELEPVSPGGKCEDLTLLCPALKPYTHIWKPSTREDEVRVFNDDVSRLFGDFEVERDWRTPAGRVVTALTKITRSIRGSASASYELSRSYAFSWSTIHNGPNDWGQDVTLMGTTYEGHIRIGDQEFVFEKNDPLISLKISAAIDYHPSPSYFEAVILPAQRKIVVLRETDKELPGLGFSPKVDLQASIENVLTAVFELPSKNGIEGAES